MKGTGLHIKYLAFALLLVVFPGTAGSIEAQTCGFGCLGLGGFYGGYTVQKYNPQGLNEYIRAYNLANASSITQKMEEFGNRAGGFRLGANFFRTRSQTFVFSLKGYYQFLKEEHDLKYLVSSRTVTNTFTMKLDNYGLGFDLGLSLFRRFDWKVIDAQVVIMKAGFASRSSAADDEQNNIDMKSEKRIYGYFAGTGVILHIVPDYLSVEATAGFTKFAAGKFVNENTDNPTNSFESINNFIKDGGISGTLQLNIGIPLY